MLLNQFRYFRMGQRPCSANLIKGDLQHRNCVTEDNNIVDSYQLPKLESGLVILNKADVTVNRLKDMAASVFAK